MSSTRDWTAFDQERREARAYNPDSPQPFADAAPAYRAAGWETVFPLPPGKKDPPPSGYTGRDGKVPSDEQYERWRETKADHNIGGRVPDGYLAIDVDQYGAHAGAETLAALKAELGPLPPADRTSSRGPDDPSGISIYKVPEGLEFPSEPVPGGGIQFVQPHHRYVVLPPSIHPEGRRYVRYGPGGNPAHLAKPLNAALKLPDKWVRRFATKPEAKANGKANVSTEELRDVLRGMGDSADSPCQAVAARLRQALADCQGSGRHDAVVGGTQNHVLALVRLGEQGHRGARDALATVRDAFVTAVRDRSKASDAKAGAEFTRGLKGALAIVSAEPTPEADKGCCGPRSAGDPNWYKAPVGEDFWERSEKLSRLSAFALERYLSRWAVLGSALGVTAAQVGSHVVLPGPPTKASLNLLVGLVAESGGGKTSAVGAVMEQLDWRGASLDTHELGTGQGVASAYVQPVKQGEPIQFAEAAMFLLDEIGSLSAHANMSGANIMSTLKSAYSGSQLGARYADKDRRRPVRSHHYRFALVAGIQPAHAGVILGDVDGGQPQRWLWLPAVEPDAPESASRWEPGWDVVPPVSASLRAYEPYSEEKFERPKEILLPVCEVATTEIHDGLAERHRGRADPLQAHARLTRLKVAALLAIWHGRAEVTDWDWATAGLVMDVSDATRKGVMRHLAAADVRQERATTRRLAERSAAADEARERRLVVDTARWIAGKVWARPDHWTVRLLKQAGSTVRRQWLGEGLDHAVAEQWVVEVAEPGQGDDRRCLQPGEVKP